jgi:hypothetical protein
MMSRASVTSLLTAVASSFVVLFMATLSGYAGMQEARKSDLTITRVIQAPGYTEAQIYAATKIWIAQNFNSAKAVIELDDKDRGQIIGNGILSYPCSSMDCLTKGGWKVHVTMRVDMKDQRFKITFSNLRIIFPPSATSPGDEFPVRTQGSLDDIRPMLLKIGPAILKSVEKEEDETDW